MRLYIVLPTESVQVGDQIYNRNAYHASAEWVEVRRVEKFPSGNVSLVTDIYTETRHGREGIAVKRQMEKRGE